MIGLAVVALILYFVAENSFVQVKTHYYTEKLAASSQMRKALEAIKDYRAAQGIFPKELGDPLITMLIGQKYSQITTEEGILSSKMTALNPNFAAVMVDLLKQAKVKKGDKIAVAATGSFPGVNLALYSACKVLNLEPVQITSIGSSSWGANEEDFTWLDIEKVLYEKGILNFKSVAASIGGGGDIGIGLSQMGRQLLRDAAMRNGIPLIEAPDLPSNIALRMKIYGDIKKYKVYVNIGGGIASLGHPANGDLIEPGFHHRLEPKNYPGLGVINIFGEKIPVIHLQNIEKIAYQYDLPMAPNPSPPVGIGRVFTKTKYDLRVSAAALVVIALLLAMVFRLDKKIFKFAENGVEPDSLL
jgi:poly-gamma-glutamate system protein